MDPKKLPTDPNEVVKDEDGNEIRPGRYVDDGSGMTITPAEEFDDGEDDEE